MLSSDEPVSFYCIILREYDAVNLVRGTIMHRFDYQFLADSLPANLLEIAGIIYDLRRKGEIRKMNV